MRVMTGIIVIAFVMGIGVAMAGDACCSSGNADAKVCNAGSMSNLVAKLSLTDEQAAKIKEICAKHATGERTAATTSNCMAEVAKVLTAEQTAKFKAMCESRACPMKKAE